MIRRGTAAATRRSTIPGRAARSTPTRAPATKSSTTEPDSEAMTGTNSAGRQEPEYHQHNTPTSGGTVYSYQGSGSQVVHNTYSDQMVRRRRQTTTRLLVGALLA